MRLLGPFARGAFDRDAAHRQLLARYAAKRPDGRRDDAAPLPRLAEPVTDFGGAGERIGRLETDESDETLPVADREDRSAVGSFEYGADEAQRILFAAGELHEGSQRPGLARSPSMAAKMSAASAVRSSCSTMPGRIGIVFMRTKIVQAEGKSKQSLRLCRGAAYLQRKLVFRKVRKPRAKANGVCGFAEAEYLRRSQSTIFLCQSAAGGGCVGRLWRDDAALRMGRLRAAALRVLTEERIFRNCILADLRSAGSHCENNLILTSGSIPYLRFDFSCEEQVYHLLSPKGGAKSVRRAPLSGSDGGSH